MDAWTLTFDLTGLWWLVSPAGDRICSGPASRLTGLCIRLNKYRMVA